MKVLYITLFTPYSVWKWLCDWWICLYLENYF